WVFRTLRWSILVRPLDPTARLRDLWSALVAGAAFNTLLPLRGGDFVKPAILTQRTGLPFATVLSTTVIERVFDLIGVGCVLVALLVVLPEDAAGLPYLPAMRRLGLLMASGGFAVLGAALVLGSRRSRDPVARALALLPPRIAE